MTVTLAAVLQCQAKLSRIAVDGHLHTVVDLATMEKFCHEHAGSIEYPPPGDRGWATTRVGSHRFAAWFEPAPVERAGSVVAAAADRILDGPTS